MQIAVFPFEVERSDDLQGVFGRQIARYFVDGLQDSGVNAERIQWFAQRGGQRAHVVIESPLPWDVVAEELADVGASLALTGHVRVHRGETTLVLRLTEALGSDLASTPASARAPDAGAGAPLSLTDGGVSSPAPRWIFEERAPRETTPCLLDRALRALLAHLNVPVSGERNPLDCHDVPMDAWTEKLLDDDNHDLVAVGSLASLAHPDHAWSHLLRHIALGPYSQRSSLELRLEQRIATWENGFQPHLALRAQRALARHRRSDVASWQRVCQLAARIHAPDALEEGLRALIRFAADPERASVELGILLVSSQRAKEAVRVLQHATHHPTFGDVATTYLGVAFAKLGDHDAATEHWQRVTHSGTDSKMVALAREFLSKSHLRASS